ncbi:hypothetical protein [Haloarchaeobius sp. DT45]|uniref:hypothetical protein n=1 Tax=Haloarchaeobius sp. DT45 TaxID=3446116 RepID=UPI003F6A96A0
MDIDFEDALVAAVERTATRAGATLALCTFAVQVLSAVGLDTEQAYLQRELLASLAGALDTTPGSLLGEGSVTFSRGALGLPASVPHWYGTLFALAATVLGIAVTVVGLRTFSGQFTEDVPRAAVAGLPGRTLHAFAGSLLFTGLVAGGLVAFVLPGVFLALSCYFVTAAVAIEDEPVVAGFRRSWELTAGRRLEAFLFLLVVSAVAISSSLTATAATVLLGGPATSQGTLALQFAATASPVARLVVVGITSVSTVFTVALTAVVFDQLRAARTRSGRVEGDLADVDPALLP